MIGGMKIMSVKPGREKQFEQLFRELREEIRRNEPGVHGLCAAQFQDDPRFLRAA